MRAVTDVARYDVSQLSEAWLAGERARALRIIAALEAEGEGLPLLLWQLGEDLHALAACRTRRRRERRPRSRCATRASGASGRARWSARQSACSAAALTPMLRALARLDAMSKGIGTGNAWDDLRDAGARLAGQLRCRCRGIIAAPAAGAVSVLFLFRLGFRARARACPRPPPPSRFSRSARSPSSERSIGDECSQSWRATLFSRSTTWRLSTSIASSRRASN